MHELNLLGAVPSPMAMFLKFLCYTGWRQLTAEKMPGVLSLEL